ncbi:MAG: MFS transporter [Chromatiales bacterium]|nr:MFS transporter [Chromatiales bacterium]
MLLRRLLTRPEDKLPVSTCVGYGVGQVGGQILRDTPALILPIYMTTVLGMEPALAGLSIVIAKCWAVAADPLAGVISDRSSSRWGRRRPFILAGGLLAALSFLVLFLAPGLQGQAALFVYMTLVYLILNTGYSLFSVPYLTMASEMTPDPNERTTLLSFRNAFLGVGLILGGALAPKLVAWVVAAGGTPGQGYQVMGLVMGIAIAASTLWLFFGTRSAPAAAPTEASVPLLEQLRIAWANKPFVVLITANIVQYISAGMSYAGGFFFFAYALGLGFRAFDVIPIWVIIISVSSIASMPALVWAAARFGKMTVYKWCLVLFALSIQAYFVADADSLWVVWLVAVGIGLFNGGFILMSFSVLTDTINYDRLQSGLSREGALSSVYSAVDKVGNALGAAIFLAFLSLIGFRESADGSMLEQTDEVLRSITLFYILVPALLHTGSILILNRYRLDPQKLKDPAQT